MIDSLALLWFKSGGVGVSLPVFNTKNLAPNGIISAVWQRLYPEYIG